MLLKTQFSLLCVRRQIFYVKYCQFNIDKIRKKINNRKWSLETDAYKR